jgi:hypothetical protein
MLGKPPPTSNGFGTLYRTLPLIYAHGSIAPLSQRLETMKLQPSPAARLTPLLNQISLSLFSPPYDMPMSPCSRFISLQVFFMFGLFLGMRLGWDPQGGLFFWFL